KALQVFADALRSCMRKGEQACRYGGEVCCVLLSRAEVGAATAFDARLRDAVRKRNETRTAAPLAYSAGLAVMTDPSRTLDILLLEADAALYSAKQRGRGRLVYQERELSITPPPAAAPTA